jgi:hypothetical protein
VIKHLFQVYRLFYSEEILHTSALDLRCDDHHDQSNIAVGSSSVNDSQGPVIHARTSVQMHDLLAMFVVVQTSSCSFPAVPAFFTRP